MDIECEGPECGALSVGTLNAGALNLSPLMWSPECEGFECGRGLSAPMWGANCGGVAYLRQCGAIIVWAWPISANVGP